METRTLKILWIAPDAPSSPPLELADELGGLGMLSHTMIHHACGAAATLSSIADALANNDADLVIWSGHSDADGLVCSGGEKISGLWLATQAAAGGPTVFVVGAPGSADCGEYLDRIVEDIAEAGISAIGFQAAATHQGISAYVVELARMLCVGATLSKANAIAKGFVANIDLATATSVVLCHAHDQNSRHEFPELDHLTQELAGLALRVSAAEGLSQHLHERFEEAELGAETENQ